MKRKIELKCKQLFLIYNSINAMEVHLIKNNIKVKTFTDIINDIPNNIEDNIKYILYKSMKHLMVLCNYIKVRQLITQIRSNLIKDYNKYIDLGNIENIKKQLNLKVISLKNNLENTKIITKELLDIAYICILSLIYIDNN